MLFVLCVMLLSLLSLAFPLVTEPLTSRKASGLVAPPFYNRLLTARNAASGDGTGTESDSFADSVSTVVDNGTNDGYDEDRSALKRDLLSVAASFDRGFGASPSARKRADEIIRELQGFNQEENAASGIDGTSRSPLEGAWRMIWTTASDVLVLGASPLSTVGAIYQIFEPPVVTNVIDFIPRVQSLLPPSVVPSSLVRAKVQTRASSRTGFPNRVGLFFEAVKLQPVELFGMDAASLPPFAANLPKLPGTDNDSGPGYFDVTYLDDELLIITQNAPGGLFALVKVPDSDP